MLTIRSFTTMRITSEDLDAPTMMRMGPMPMTSMMRTKGGFASSTSSGSELDCQHTLFTFGEDRSR